MEPIALFQSDGSRCVYMSRSTGVTGVPGVVHVGVPWERCHGPFSLGLMFYTWS